MGLSVKGGRARCTLAAMAHIHPTTIVDPQAVLASDCTIGPGCVIRGKVEIGPGVELVGNVYLNGPLKIGARTRVWPGAMLGFEPQDYKFKPDSPTAGTLIGSDCLIREGVTIHAASKMEHPTTIGDRVFMMVNSHAGHDAVVGNDVILVNGALLAGHTHVMDKATISGNTGIHQFCRVGRFAFVSGCAAVSTEIPPFCVAHGRNTIAGINLVGMRRNGFGREDVTKTREAFREVFKANLPKPMMIERLTTMSAGCAPVTEMLEFVKASKRPICPFRHQSRDDGDME